MIGLTPAWRSRSRPRCNNPDFSWSSRNQKPYQPRVPAAPRAAPQWIVSNDSAAGPTVAIGVSWRHQGSGAAARADRSPEGQPPNSPASTMKVGSKPYRGLEAAAIRAVFSRCFMAGNPACVGGHDLSRWLPGYDHPPSRTKWGRGSGKGSTSLDQPAVLPVLVPRGLVDELLQAVFLDGIGVEPARGEQILELGPRGLAMAVDEVAAQQCPAAVLGEGLRRRGRSYRGSRRRRHRP